MALQFDSSPYLQVWNAQRQAEQNQPQYGQQILQSLQLLGDQRRQQQLLDLQKQKIQSDADQTAIENAQTERESVYKYGVPISSDISVGTTGGQGVSRLFGGLPRGMQGPEKPLSVGTSSRLVDQFNSWRAGGMKPEGARPEYMAALGQDERKQFYQAANPKPIPGYVIPTYDEEGGVSGFTPLPVGTKPAPAARPQQDYVVPQYDAQGNVVGFTPLPSGTRPAPAARPMPQSKTKIGTPEADAAFNLYETARDGLLSGLGGSVTGPFLGRAPALTSNQQVAEGAVAAMAPVLKQLFRVAGEGVFTDRDQALLLDMIPTRSTRPEARAKQIENIDNIVKAKLGIPNDRQIDDGTGAKIRVRNKQTGQTGTISEKYFDPNKYERI